MIDLRKPLEGVPGLLLMAAVFLFGTAIGFSIALSTEYWIKASDGLANLWGGIIGAGLGAALAVMGALYLQRMERKAQLTGSVNQTVAVAEELRSRLIRAQRYLNPSLASGFGNEDDLAEALFRALREAEELATELPNAFDLPPAVHSSLRAYRSQLRSFLGSLVDTLEHSDEAIDYDQTAEVITRSLEELDRLRRLLKDI